jgi:hypothetical protein
MLKYSCVFLAGLFAGREAPQTVLDGIFQTAALQRVRKVNINRI